jgi:hypothetical protein
MALEKFCERLCCNPPYSDHGERIPMEQLDCNLLFRLADGLEPG